MVAISIIGIIIAMALLCYLMYKGVNVLVVGILASVVIALTGGVKLYDALKVQYMEGFVGFVKSNLLVFVAGALLGKVYEVTNGAKAIANMIVLVAGKRFAAISMPLAVGIMTYGGIQGYVLCFAVFPIALEVYRAADIPRRFIPAAIVMGCCTFSSHGPGNPQVPNVALSNALGTPLSSGFVIGMVIVVIQMIIGFILLTYLVNKAKNNGEHFVAKEFDVFKEEVDLPNGLLALIPLLLTLICINLKRNGAPLIQVEFGVFIGAVVAYLLMRKYHKDGVPALNHVGTAIGNAITAAAATSAMVAVGSVAKAAAGFDSAITALTSIPGPPLLSVGIGSILIAAVCGAASGGVALAGPLFGPIYAAKGVALEVLHRTMLIGAHVGGTLPNNGFTNTNILGIAKETYKDAYGPLFLCVPVTNFIATILDIIHRTMLVASSGLDTLPHNGFVVTVTNGVANETHKDAYIPVFWLAVVTPIIATITTIILFTLLPNLP